MALYTLTSVTSVTTPTLIHYLRDNDNGVTRALLTRGKEHTSQSAVRAHSV